MGAMKWIFSQFLSATTESLVALVSAPRMTPSCGEGGVVLSAYLFPSISLPLYPPFSHTLVLTRNTRPAMVVPVLRACGARSPGRTRSKYAFLEIEGSELGVGSSTNAPVPSSRISLDLTSQLTLSNAHLLSEKRPIAKLRPLGTKPPHSPLAVFEREAPARLQRRLQHLLAGRADWEQGSMGLSGEWDQGE